MSGTGTAPSGHRSTLRLSTGRHPRDIVRAAVATAALALCSLIAVVRGVDPVELAILTQLSRLPAWSAPFWHGLTWAGSPVAIAGAAGLALYMKRVRLGAQLAGAGAAAWALGWVMDAVIGPRRVPGALLEQLGARAQVAREFPFPASHVAVAAALAGAATPYLGRGGRNLAWTGVVLVGVADVYEGAHLPVGVLAGGFLGWGLAMVAHFVGGAPGRKTSEAAVTAALANAGLDPYRVEPLRQHLLGPIELAVTTTSGERLQTEIIHRLHRHAGPLYKLRRFFASLEVEDEPPLSTPRHEAEHEAFVALLAERAGVRTPSVVLARELEHGPAFLARVRVDGERLSGLRATEIDDSLLDEIWRQVRLLGDARIAHHDLRAEKILVDPGGQPWVLDLTFARAGVGTERTAQDVAVAMVSLVSVVGIDRALASAQRVLRHESLESALPYLQVLALPRRVRRQLSDERYLLTELRDTVAERVDRPPPAFRSPVRPRTLMSLLVGGGAVYLLLPQLASFSEVFGAIRTADYGWLAVAFLTGVVFFPVSTLAFLGASREKIPFWRTTAVQVAAAFTGRTTPGGVGFFGLNIIYLERLGIRRAGAVGVLVLNRAGLGFVSVTASVLAVAALGLSGLTGRISVPTGWPVLVAAAVLLIGAGFAFGSPFGRRRIVRPTWEVVQELLRTVRHPVRAFELLGGSAGFLALNGLSLVACLAAFQARFSVPAVLAVYVVSFTLSQFAPTPGNLGAMETVLVAGLSATGIPATLAVVAVLTSRVLNFWLPVLPGVVMFRYLQHRGVV